jgi:hypothetical protein
MWTREKKQHSNCNISTSSNQKTTFSAISTLTAAATKTTATTAFATLMSEAV